MKYHLLINGSHRQKMPKNNTLANSNQPLDRSRQRHVTFRQVNHINSSIKSEFSKPKYNFTYGQPYYQTSFNPIPIKGEFIHQENSSFSRAPLENSPHREIQTEIYKNLSGNLLKERSPSEKKRKLKIFPEKYDKGGEVKNSETKNSQLKQIGQLKGQIQRLRQEINNLTINFSKNTSRDFTQSIYKNQADRTKRLSELNQFNQKLYSQLAMKLKQISLDQYENALQIQNSNAKFLQSVYSSATKQRLHQTLDLEKESQGHHKFMDIHEFEKEYQEKYSQPGNSPNKTLNFDRNGGSSKVELESPFLVRQNTFEADSFKTMQPDSSRRKDKHDPFTFHKQTAHQLHQFTKTQQQKTQNKLILQTTIPDKNIKEIRPNKQNTPVPAKASHRKLFQIDNQGKEKRQIHDMNRELQNKIMRKRSASEYAYLAKTRKY